ncbi:hypothetical protein BGS_0197 [Beggiatoa sp. SS]|nr:hypothetical protein BGS_0197 [Beggiatoa sp. SS]
MTAKKEKGATGRPVPLLTQYLIDRSKMSSNNVATEAPVVSEEE